MTLIVDDQSAQPGTHVVLIGIGDYPFLKDGSAPPAQTFDLHMEMGQLSSPPRSLGELATWFSDTQNGFNNPDRPLRSLELLCSASQDPFEWTDPAGAKHAIGRATAANVSQAVLDWKARASRSADNLAVFYFCGHGLSFGESQNSLLLEDWGGDTNDPANRAISFNDMRLGLMNQCDARQQCYFIDACRTPPTKAYIDKYGAALGARIVGGGLNRQIRDIVAPAFFATRLMAKAYGFTDQSSLFTQGMLRCFRGVASRDAASGWEVTVEAMAEGINKSVESLAFATQPQYCQPLETGQSFMLHRVRDDPEVIVKVFTRDLNLLPSTIFVHLCESTNETVERPPGELPWWLPVTMGKHTFKALAAANRQELGSRSKTVSPPSSEIGL